MEVTLGVALGRSYIFGAYVDNDMVQNVNCEGAGTFGPNALSFDSSKILVGMKAAEQASKNPKGTFTQEEIQLLPEAKYW